jgi:hypothetical protein
MVAVGRGGVISCRSDSGDALKGGACGALPGFDGIAQPRLRKLTGCPAAAGATGKLSAVFSLDFTKNTVGVDVGRSSTVPNSDGFASCLRTAMQGVSIGAIDHEHPRYTLVYSVSFKESSPEGAGTGGAGVPSAVEAPTPIASASTAADEGTAEVVWEVALVRDHPRTGDIVARLARGTRVQLGAGEEGWYRVKYGSGFANEGWLYRGAIGK